MDEMFEHKDSFGDEFRMWFCQDGSAILATGNGPADGICIEVNHDAVVELATFLANGVVASTVREFEEEQEERDYKFIADKVAELNDWNED